MEQELKNQIELKDFVEKHQLRDSFSTINFKARVTIKTAQNEMPEEAMNVLITFEEYNNCGKLTLLDNHLDPSLYPTEFVAKWQKMEHVGGVFLHITDNHTRNPKIGRYEVKIVPLSKSKE